MFKTYARVTEARFATTADRLANSAVEGNVFTFPAFVAPSPTELEQIGYSTDVMGFVFDARFGHSPRRVPLSALLETTRANTG